MPISPFSRIVQPAAFEAPLDLNLYTKGMMYKEGIAKENLQNIATSYNNLIHTPAYGVDATKLDEITNKYKSQLEGLNQSNLGDLTTISQINNIVSSAKNDPDLLAIARRGAFYNSELKKKEDAESKGREYISPGLNALSQYYNGQDFLQNPNISMSYGFISPDLIKYQEAAQKLAPVNKVWETLPNGERMQVETQSKEDLSKAYFNLLAQDPNGQKYLDYQFEQNNKDIDWNDKGATKVYNDIQKLQDAKQQAIQMGYDPSLFDNQINRLTKIYNSGVTGVTLKNIYKEDYIKNFVDTWADGVKYLKEGDIKLGELDKMKMDFDNKVAIENLKQTNKLNSVKNGSLKSYYTYYYKVTGHLPVDEDGKFIEPQNLPNIPGAVELKKAAQKAYTKEKGERTLSNTISDMESGFVTSYDQPILESTVENRYIDLGYPKGTKIKSVEFKNNKIIIDADVPGLLQPLDGKKEFEVKDFKNKLIGNDSSPSSSSSPNGFVKYEDNGIIYNLPVDKEKAFLSKHPNAVKGQ